jgi:DNA-binding MarR family transcriptional regulator
LLFDFCNATKPLSISFLIRRLTAALLTKSNNNIDQRLKYVALTEKGRKYTEENNKIVSDMVLFDFCNATKPLSISFLIRRLTAALLTPCFSVISVIDNP